MIKKQTYIIQSLSLLLLVISVIGCDTANNKSTISCVNTPNECMKLVDGNTSVTINSPIIFVENLYQITVESNEPIKQAHIEGVNMNMGKLPLVLTKTEQGYVGKFNLGMCSEPVMKWKLTLYFGNATPKEFEFNSYWSKEYFNKNN